MARLIADYLRICWPILLHVSGCGATALIVWYGPWYMLALPWLVLVAVVMVWTDARMRKIEQEGEKE